MKSLVTNLNLQDGVMERYGFVARDTIHQRCRISEKQYTPDQAVIAKLTEYAYKFLEREPGSGHALEVVREGKAFRPVSCRTLPFITGVPPSKLSGQWDPELDETNFSVFLCCGHGSYGVTLGMGRGR